MAFSGTVSSDFMKLASIPESKKQQYIDYAGTDFYSIRSNIIEYIKSVYPLDYQTRSNLNKLLELVGVDMMGPVAAAAGATLTCTTAPTVASFPLTYTAENRVFAITSKEDGAPVNYTLYKIENNAIQNIQNTAASFQLEGSEAVNNTTTSSIFENVALLEGSLSVQKGTFDTLEGNKRIALTETPIVEGSIQVYIDTGNISDPANGPYTQVNRLFSASGNDDRIYQVIYDDNYAATVLFGDNSLGISPPAEAEFTVVYRVGGGSRGNIGQEAINVETKVIPADSPTATIAVTTENRTDATGGSEAETSTHAKKYAPYTFKRQDRVVTLEDYIAIGNSFRTSQGTIGKTTAAVRDAFSSGNIIDLFTLEKADDLRLQKASPTFKEQLLAEIEPKKMLTDEVTVVDGLIRTLDLVVTMHIDKESQTIETQIQQEVSQVILDHFSIDNADFGKPFVASELNREIFRLPNVRYSTVNNMPEITNVDFNEIIQLNNFTINTVLV